MMIKFIKIVVVLLIILSANVVFASDEVKTLSAGISLNEQVPVSLMGIWRVASALKSTDSPGSFKKSGVDIWNLSKEADVITLSNPFTGAKASIRVSYINKNTIRFSKEGNYDKQNLTDTVEITLEGDKFQGVNILKLESLDDKTSKTAEYVLRGEKISGTSILER